MGSIFVYNLLSDSKDPLQTFKKIHGRLGVQSCTVIDNSLVSTGRDGTLRFYKFVQSESAFIEYLYAKNMTMDWVSRLIINKNNFYVLGFKEVLYTFAKYIQLTHSFSYNLNRLFILSVSIKLCSYRMTF